MRTFKDNSPDETPVCKVSGCEAIGDHMVATVIRIMGTEKIVDLPFCSRHHEMCADPAVALSLDEESSV